jgi:hypothetical protein
LSRASLLKAEGRRFYKNLLRTSYLEKENTNRSGEKTTMLDKNNIPFVPTHKHNSSIRKSDNTIENLTEQFTKLQRENRHLIIDRRGVRTWLFRTKEEKLQDEHNLEKLRAYHQHEMEIGSAICEAKKQDIQMQIASALAQKQVILDTQTKERISEIYHNFGRVMNDRIREAAQVYLDGLRQVEMIPNPKARQRLLEYTEQKFEQDCSLIEDLANDVLRNIYADLEKRQ